MSHYKLRSFTCVIQPFRYTCFYVICVLFYFNKIVFKFISCTISLATPIQRTPQRFNINLFCIKRGSKIYTLLKLLLYNSVEHELVLYELELEAEAGASSLYGY
jgi:hypothetical protein